MRALRVVCYVNQFFGQRGGEEQAGVGPEVVAGAVGAARAVQQALGDAGTVVATVRCGDNYVAERPDAAVAELLAPGRGPAARTCSSRGRRSRRGATGSPAAPCALPSRRSLGVPAVTGMHEENPGVELYRRRRPHREDRRRHRDACSTRCAAS